MIGMMGTFCQKIFPLGQGIPNGVEGVSRLKAKQVNPPGSQEQGPLAGPDHQHVFVGPGQVAGSYQPRQTCSDHYSIVSTHESRFLYLIFYNSD
jgi:hypothetical protein